jgi:hypothetical protein
MSQLIQKLSISRTTGIRTTDASVDPNPARVSYFVQNLSTEPLFVKEGPGCTSSDFTFVLSAGASNDDGNGSCFEASSGQVYVGEISFNSVDVRFTLTEREE